MKQVYVVLGMARSGTSAIARGLQALGIDLGDKLTPASERWNAKGFFEDNDIVYKVNRGVLYAIDHPWMSVDIYQDWQKHEEKLQPLQRLAVSLLQSRLAQADYWGFKDPRTAKLLPFWQSVFRETGVQDHYVIALRNPLASANSYRSLSGCDLEEALLLWLTHMIPAVEGTMGKKRLVVSYDLLLQDPHLQMNRIKIGLELPDLADSAEIDLYANKFLDKKLHRFNNSDSELVNEPAVAVVPLVRKVYDLLMQVARDECQLEDPAFVSAWREVCDEFTHLSPLYAYIDSLYKKNKTLTRELRTIKKTVWWRLLAPLRMIDDYLRTNRRKKREQRRLLRSYG